MSGLAGDAAECDRWVPAILREELSILGEQLVLVRDVELGMPRRILLPAQHAEFVAQLVHAWRRHEQAALQQVEAECLPALDLLAPPRGIGGRRELAVGAAPMEHSANGQRRAVPEDRGAIGDEAAESDARAMASERRAAAPKLELHGVEMGRSRRPRPQGLGFDAKLRRRLASKGDGVLSDATCAIANAHDALGIGGDRCASADAQRDARERFSAVAFEQAAEARRLRRIDRKPVVDAQAHALPNAAEVRLDDRQEALRVVSDAFVDAHGELVAAVPSQVLRELAGERGPAAEMRAAFNAVAGDRCVRCHRVELDPHAPSLPLGSQRQRVRDNDDAVKRVAERHFGSRWQRDLRGRAWDLRLCALDRPCAIEWDALLRADAAKQQRHRHAAEQKADHA